MIWYFLLIFLPLTPGGEPYLQDVGPFKSERECEVHRAAIAKKLPYDEAGPLVPTSCSVRLP